MSSLPPSGAQPVTAAPGGHEPVLDGPPDTRPTGGTVGGPGVDAGGAGGGGVLDGTTPDEGAPESGPAKRPPRRGQWVVEMLAIVIVALVLAVVLRTFVVQTFFIPSGSMEPTLQIGDRILVDKLSYHLHGIGRGDIVVFKRPPAEDCGGPAVNDLVKRVIGMPGETISLHDGQVYINGKELPEPWLPASVQGVTSPADGSPWDLKTPYHIPPGQYFVMGDNRTESCDSRYWGPIPASLIVGKVVVRVWPLTQFRFF